MLRQRFLAASFLCVLGAGTTAIAHARQRAPVPVVGTPPPASSSAAPAGSSKTAPAKPTSSAAAPAGSGSAGGWFSPPPPPSSSATPPAGGTSAGATVDVVLLRNGEVLRGRVTEIVPEHHVSLLLENGGATRVISWKELDRVTLGVSATRAGTAGKEKAVPLVEIPRDAEMIGPTVRLHVNAPRKVQVFRKPSQTGVWIEACSSPCDIELPIGDTYRVQGKGMSTSNDFRIDATHSNITIDPSSTSGSILGGAIAGAGAAAGFVGLVMIAASKDTRLGGVIALVLGTGIGLAGFFIYRSMAKTEILDPNAVPPASAKSSDPHMTSIPGLSASEARALPSASFPLLFEQTF